MFRVSLFAKIICSIRYRTKRQLRWKTFAFAKVLISKCSSFRVLTRDFEISETNRSAQSSTNKSNCNTSKLFTSEKGLESTCMHTICRAVNSISSTSETCSHAALTVFQQRNMHIMTGLPFQTSAALQNRNVMFTPPWGSSKIVLCKHESFFWHALVQVRCSRVTKTQTQWRSQPKSFGGPKCLILGE